MTRIRITTAALIHTGSGSRQPCSLHHFPTNRDQPVPNIWSPSPYSMATIDGRRQLPAPRRPNTSRLRPLALTAPESFASGHFARAKSEHTYKRTEQGTLQRSKQEMEGRGEHLTGEHERWRRNQWLLPVGRGQREGEGHHTPEWCQVSAVLAISRERRAYKSQKPRSL